ncbi:hypothetical protein HQ590_15830 [bacterium]|nr:hypothetical protein [bacterium]
MTRPLIFISLVLVGVTGWTGPLLAQQYQELPATRPAARPRALVELQAKREAQQAELEQQLLQRFDQLKKDCAVALGRLQNAYQSKGDLEGVLAVRAEQRRLQGGLGAAPASNQQTPSELRSLQEAYQQAQDRILQDQQTKVDEMLRAYVRSLKELQRTLTTQGDLDGAVAVRAEARQYGDRDTPSVPAPAPREPPAATARTAPGQGLVLRPQWDQRLKDPTCAADAGAVFSRFCRARVNLDPAPEIELIQGITYLMPLQQALGVLGKPAAIRRPVGCTAFPRDSFFYHTVKRQDVDGFSLLLVITDQANQVVGIELVDEAPKRPPSRRRGGEGREERATVDHADLRVYDFIRAGTKSSPQMCVRHVVTRRARVVQVETELIAWKSNYRWRPANESPCSHDWWDEDNTRCRERIRLILAEPIAELILQYLQQ